jgi:hypothetical protein
MARIDQQDNVLIDSQEFVVELIINDIYDPAILHTSATTSPLAMVC